MSNENLSFFQMMNNKYKGKNINEIAKDVMKKANDLKKATVNIMSLTGIAGFQFDILKREEITLSSDITTHYVDSNRPVQDHIAQKPITITLRGYTGDYFYSVSALKRIAQAIVPTMNLVEAFVPKVSNIVKQLKNKKNKNAQQADSSSIITFNTVDIFKIAQGLYKLKSRQTRAYFFLKALWKAQSIFSVETTYERFDNMVIKDLKILREDNADITDFTVTFQQMQFTHSITTSVDGAIGRRNNQLAPKINKGIVRGVSKNV